MQTSILHIETLTSPPITIQDTQFQVRSQLFQLRFPPIKGGVIWNRPVAVVVRTVDGQENILLIPDVTQTAIWTLAGICITGMFIRMFLRRKKSKS